jgi:hypothetical protein
MLVFKLLQSEIQVARCVCVGHNSGNLKVKSHEATLDIVRKRVPPFPPLIVITRLVRASAARHLFDGPQSIVLLRLQALGEHGSIVIEMLQNRIGAAPIPCSFETLVMRHLSVVMASKKHSHDDVLPR